MRDVTSRSQCLNENELNDFLSEQLSEQLESEIKAHLGDCPSCQTKLEELAAEPAMWSELNEHAIASPDTPAVDESNANWNHLLQQLVPSEDPRFCGRLAGYEVCGLIGSGGTGIVVKAFEPRLNRYVAIKVLQPNLASHGPARRRFERESRAIAAVAHEHVVPIHAVDEFRGLPFIVMQYIPGLSLLQRIEKSGSLTTCEVTRIGFQIASALAAAHSQGIIHRDVKPANIILEDTVERAMVTDFGLASVSDEATMTRTGTISGTPQYMSPEQARGESLDPRTDLFSLGSLLYAACTARAPFRAETVFGIIHRVCHTEARAIREINPDIAPWLVQFIEKLMNKQVNQRFSSAAEVANLLETELAHLQNPTSSPEPERHWIRSLESGIAFPETATTLAASTRSIGSSRKKLLVGLGAAIALPIFGAIAIPALDQKLDLGLLSSFATPEEESGTPDGSGSGQPEPSTPASGGDGVSANKQDTQEDGEQASGSDSASNVESGSGSESKDTKQDTPAVANTQIARSNNQGDTEAVSTERLVSSFAGLSPDEEPLVEWERVADPGLSVTSRFTQRTDQSFNIAADKTLVLQLDRGDVEIRQTELDYASLVVLKKIKAGNQQEAEKIASYHQVKVEKDSESGDLQIQMDLDQAFEKRGGDEKIERLIVGLALPVGVNIEVNAQAGDVRSEALVGSISATTQLGDIRCSSITGDLWARTHGGEIVAVDGCSGDVDLMAAHGNVCVAGVEGSARLRCTDGNIYGGSNSGTLSAHGTGGEIRLAAVDCPTSAHIEDGQITLRLKEHPKANCKLTAAAGDILVRVGENVKADLQSNRIAESSDLDWKREVLSQDDVAREVLVSRFNGGGKLIELSASSGEVIVETTKAAQPTEQTTVRYDNPYFSLGGSGSHSERVVASKAALEKTSGEPRPGAMVPIEIENGQNIDGYTLYLPVSYEQTEEAYPMILYMQGGYGVGGPITRINDWGLPRLLRDENSLSTERNRMLLDGFIVVSPHINTGGYDDHPEVLKRIMEDVSAKYRVDSKRIYATGLSRGAHASWDLVEKMPGVFAAVAPIAGRPSLKDFSGFKSTAAWVSHNRRDPTIKFTQALEGTRKIQKVTETEFAIFENPVPTAEEVEGAKYILIQPDSDRHDAWTDVYCSEVFYRWLLDQSLPAKADNSQSASVKY